MADYAPGMRVVIRDEEWQIQKVVTNSLNRKVLHCIGVSSLVKDKEAAFLTDLEQIDIVNPADIEFVADDSPFYKKTLLFLESQLRQQIPTDSKLYIGHRAAMDPLEYQLKPAFQALQKTRQRILIADTVGLGKTLEAGILMAELIARGKGRRILVITVKSMMTQFQKEIWNRFTIPLVRLDSRKIQKIRESLPSNYNPFVYYDKVIVSVDTLKRDIEYRTHLEKAYWDIIVIDEAQNVAERGQHQAQRARLAKLLANRSDTMIMLSATPHDGRPKSFASLMNMLDPTAIANPENYTKEDIQGLFIRRFKENVKDEISGVYPERKIYFEKCLSSVKEEKAYDILSSMHLNMDKKKSKHTDRLFKTSLEKSLFSSPSACIKSIEERLKKLKSPEKDGVEVEQDIASLEELKSALDDITPQDFACYQHLLNLLNSSQYGWDRNADDDRIVIFTERLETMRYLAANLRKDLNLGEQAVQTMYGTMSDKEQQDIVEKFCSAKSNIKILVASDVASEGLNLHKLCHRLIHFDIPWSLMVFQQRNGRIDRYGQKKDPDIRYMLIESKNALIKGDMRILEILIRKEEQAQKNIGDSTLLYERISFENGKIIVNDEKIVVDAIEGQTSVEEMGEQLDSGEDLLGALFNKLSEQGTIEPEPDSVESISVETTEVKTIFKDLDYVEQAIKYLNETEKYSLTKLSNVKGIEIKLTPEMLRRLRATVPEEAMPKDGILCLSSDRKFCTDEMDKSLFNSLNGNSWPKFQYLWALHPIMGWLNDKLSLQFKRQQVPIVEWPKKLQADEIIFIVSGRILNQKSVPVIDEWFGLKYCHKEFKADIPINEIISYLELDNNFSVPNIGDTSSEKIALAHELLPDVVLQVQKHMEAKCKGYNLAIRPRLDQEISKLVELKEKHKKYYEDKFREQKRKLQEKERTVEELFEQFNNWVEETLTIENSPCIRIIAAFVGR